MSHPETTLSQQLKPTRFLKAVPETAKQLRRLRRFGVSAFITAF